MPTGAGFKKLAADQVIIGFKQFVSEAGVKKAVVTGDTAYIFEDSALAKLTTSRVTIYDENGKVSAEVVSRRGDINTATQGMIARGNVVLTTNDGRRIETEELHYDPNSHRVWSSSPTVQRHQGSTLRGAGFEADDRFQNVRVSNARTSGGGGLKITF